ncbi:MAG: EmrB/QacA subfamily drug resistance transporter [Candidatus Aldehydirespiratoraceae bacterium]|jgi:EmrB/QacA subfamily drug resistance transporter
MALPAIDLMALGAAGPEVAGDLGRLDQIAWLFVSYQLSLVVTVPLYGKLGDLRGRRTVYLSAVTVFTVASLFAGLAWSFPVLLLARIAQGVGAGGVISQSTAVIADLVPARERGRYSWVTPSVWTVASFAGPVLGGAIAEHAGWRWIFLINLPLGVLAIWFVRDAFPERRDDEERSFDRLGATMLVVSYGALVLALSMASEAVGWSHPMVLGLLGLGFITLAGFVRHEWSANDPVMPLQLLRIPVVRASAATTFLIGLVNFMAVAFLPLMLQVVLDLGTTQAGLAILPTTFMLAITSTIVGRTVARTGHYRVWPAAGSVVFAGGYAVLAGLGPSPSMIAVWIGTGLLGVGMGAGTPVFVLSMQNAVGHRDLGAVSAMSMFMRNTGQVFGTALAGTWFAVRLSHHLDRLVVAGRLDGVRDEDLRGDIDVIRGLDADVEALVREAFRLAATDTFRIGFWVALASVVVAVTIPQLPLRESLDE